MPAAEALRPMTVSVDYGGRMASTSRRSSSVPPSTTVSYARQQTPGPQQQRLPSRRLSSVGSTADLRSAAFSSRSPMPGLSSRHSASVSVLPVGRGSRSNLRLTVDADDEPRGSTYSTKPLLSFQRTSRPLRSSYQTGKMKTRYLDDIEEEDTASRAQVSDLRMRAWKAKECLDQHRQVLDRLRTLQMNGPAPAVVTVSPLTSSLPPVTSTSSVRHENTRSYLPVRTPPMSVIRSALTLSPARRVLRGLLGRGKTSQSYD